MSKMIVHYCVRCSRNITQEDYFDTCGRGYDNGSFTANGLSKEAVRKLVVKINRRN